MRPEDITGPQDLQNIYQQWGWIGVGAAASFAVCKLWRSGWIDRWLAQVVPGFAWSGKRRYVRMLMVGVLTSVGTMLSGVITGQSWWAALAAGVALGVPAAMGMHEGVVTAQKAASERASIRTRLEPLP